MALEGKGSWFGGPSDPTDSGHTASGGTTKEPGIAVYNHKTLGGYWRVRAPNGKTAVLKQTDIGPAPWTNRKVDVTYSALGQLGYNEHNFPTDSGFKAEYLGRSPMQAHTAATRTAGVEGVTSRPSVNTAGLAAAQQKAAGARSAATLFQGNSAGDTALRGALEKAGQAPSEAKYSTGPFMESVAPPRNVGQVEPILHTMNQIAQAKVPYLWGGGHGEKFKPGEKVKPLDCSGAVSAALGINPKVSGEFEQFGAPGKGQHVTIYANGHHVIMEVNGHFWGTSHSNPGGGAGWIPPGTVTPQYLSQFVARHPGGM